jgi:hypothetical protein
MYDVYAIEPTLFLLPKDAALVATRAASFGRRNMVGSI